MEYNLTREEKCKLLSELYGWNLEQLLKNNENQINTLFSSCKDEEGVLRKPETK